MPKWNRTTIEIPHSESILFRIDNAQDAKAIVQCSKRRVSHEMPATIAIDWMLTPKLNKAPDTETQRENCRQLSFLSPASPHKHPPQTLRSSRLKLLWSAALSSIVFERDKSADLLRGLLVESQSNACLASLLNEDQRNKARNRFIKRRRKSDTHCSLHFPNGDSSVLAGLVERL